MRHRSGPVCGSVPEFSASMIPEHVVEWAVLTRSDRSGHAAKLVFDACIIIGILGLPDQYIIIIKCRLKRYV
jgi:hypothetical protein